MWLLFAREPTPDAPYWLGRRWLAIVDAVVWPLARVLLVQAAPAPAGVFGPVVAAVALLVGASRVHRALFVNHRYRLTTWRWTRWAAALVVIELVLKLLVK